MMNGNCESSGKTMKLCPLSFGLAVGFVSFFAVVAWTAWVLTYGMPSMMVAMHMPPPTIHSGFMHALWAFLRGFLFGFFIALFYDLILGAFCCLRSSKCDESSAKK